MEEAAATTDRPVRRPAAARHGLRRVRARQPRAVPPRHDADARQATSARRSPPRTSSRGPTYHHLTAAVQRCIDVGVFAPGTDPARRHHAVGRGARRGVAVPGQAGPRRRRRPRPVRDGDRARRPGRGAHRPPRRPRARAIGRPSRARRRGRSQRDAGEASSGLRADRAVSPRTGSRPAAAGTGMFSSSGAPRRRGSDGGRPGCGSSVSLPALAQRVTVFGSTRNSAATSAGVSSSSASGIVQPCRPPRSRRPDQQTGRVYGSRRGVRLVPLVRRDYATDLRRNGRSVPHS